jgi:methylenetetrahydrofolate dehydrogenase (NADP+)/methenyltetrahydrofolate cyclohydrolase
VRFNGTELATKLYADLQKRVDKLKKKNVTPHLVVFLVGENPASVAYVTLKQRKGEEIGAKVTLLRYDTSVTTQELAQKVQLLNDDPYVHAILIQRPLPDHIDVEQLELLTSAEKDVDGFHPDSPYVLPLPLAVGKILEDIYAQRHPELVSGSQKGNPKMLKQVQHDRFISWLQSKNVVVIGKGPTGGGPVLEYLISLKVIPHIIDSKTIDPVALKKAADIIISCVGRLHIIKPEQLKKGVILVSVGIFRNAENKLSGDYDPAAIEDIASYYTPTPGGVGPVNVAMLIDNVLTATEKQTS